MCDRADEWMETQGRTTVNVLIGMATAAYVRESQTSSIQKPQEFLVSMQKSPGINTKHPEASMN